MYVKRLFLIQVEKRRKIHTEKFLIIWIYHILFELKTVKNRRVPYIHIMNNYIFHYAHHRDISNSRIKNYSNRVYIKRYLLNY